MVEPTVSTLSVIHFKSSGFFCLFLFLTVIYIQNLYSTPSFRCLSLCLQLLCSDFHPNHSIEINCSTEIDISERFGFRSSTSWNSSISISIALYCSVSPPASLLILSVCFNSTFFSFTKIFLAPSALLS